MRIRGWAAQYIVVLPVICAITAATSCADSQSFREAEKRRIDVLAQISPCVVCVMPPNGAGGGSGVLISADGYAISNYHVTSGSGDFMKCGLNDGRVYDAVIVGIDPTGDVAMIKLLGRDDFPCCTVGDSDQVQVGDEVLALGNPFLLAADFSPTVTYGIVSGIHRYQYPANTFLEYTDCIQIDASINPGNSGGPLFDIQGRWIGINGRASFEKRGRINTGAAYAISVRQIQLFIDHLKSGRIVDHGAAGFVVGTTNDGTVQVDQVSDLSDVWRRGLRPGHELISFAGRPLSSANDFKNVLGIFPEGIRLPLTYRDKDGVHTVTTRLGPLHDFQQAPELPGERRRGPQPQIPDEPEDPDQDDPNHRLEIKREKEFPPPEQYRHLFEKRTSFANYYFNQQQISRIRSPLMEALSGQPMTTSRPWMIRLHPDDETADAEVSVAGAGAQLTIGNQSWQQFAEEPDPESDPPGFSGFLTAMMQWHRLFNGAENQFAEVTYIGAEQHLPLNEFVHTLLTRRDAVTCRWYFANGSVFPRAVDVDHSAGYDEARIVFDNWTSTAAGSVPTRMGVVDHLTEQIRWFEVKSLAVKTTESNAKEAA